MIRARRALMLAAVSVAAVVFAGAVLAASGGNNRPPKGSNNQGVKNRVTTPRPVQSDKFKYANVQTGWLTLSPGDFAPDSASSGYFNNWAAAELNSPVAGTCFNAGVHLPQGARILWVDFYYRSGSGSDLVGEFWRTEVATSTAELVGFVNPVDDTGLDSSSSSPVVPGLQKVRNAVYGYQLGVCAYDDTYFHGARVEYTYRSAGD